jgi:NAD(P)-dependent dehydrogenase (short-subunit alcohol dehydrogenase family)
MTRYLATYWNEEGIRVNSLSPGGIYDNQPEEFVRKVSNLVPLGRMANRDEYQSAVQFLCSDASTYMTGQNIVIDGGRSIW